VTIKALLDTYYEALAKRADWDGTIAEDFAFTGGSPDSGSRGKAAYNEAIRRFSRVFDTVRVKRAIVQGESACVIATYGLVSPSGKKTQMDIAEVWGAREGRLASLAIYFDTATWKAFMAS